MRRLLAPFLVLLLWSSPLWAPTSPIEATTALRIAMTYLADDATILAKTCTPGKAPMVRAADTGNEYKCVGSAYVISPGYTITGTGTEFQLPVWGAGGQILGDSGYGFDPNAGSPIASIAAQYFYLLTGTGSAPTLYFGKDTGHAMTLTRDDSTGLVTFTTVGSPAGTFGFGRSVAVTGNLSVTDDAYNGTSWNGSVNVPTKNAVRDEIELVLLMFQPIDSDLTSFAALGTAADKMPYTTAAHTWAEAAITSQARGFLDDATAADNRATIGALYTIPIAASAANGLGPADATTYYFGGNGKLPMTTSQTSQIYIRRAGIIRVAEIDTNTQAGVVGTNENISVYLRLNDTTDTLIATIGAATQSRAFSNTAINVTVASGDFVEIKMVCPTWATNPTSMAIGGYLLVE